MCFVVNLGYAKERTMARMGPEMYYKANCQHLLLVVFYLSTLDHLTFMHTAQNQGMSQFLPTPTKTFRSRVSWWPG